MARVSCRTKKGVDRQRDIENPKSLEILNSEFRLLESFVKSGATDIFPVPRGTVMVGFTAAWEAALCPSLPFAPKKSIL